MEKLALCSKVLYDHALLEVRQQLHRSERIIDGFETLFADDKNVLVGAAATTYLSRRSRAIDAWASFCKGMALEGVEKQEYWEPVGDLLFAQLTDLMGDLIPWGQLWAMYKADGLLQQLSMVARNIGFLGESHFQNSMSNIGIVMILNLNVKVRCNRCGTAYTHLRNDSDHRLCCDDCYIETPS